MRTDASVESGPDGSRCACLPSGAGANGRRRSGRLGRRVAARGKGEDVVCAVAPPGGSQIYVNTKDFKYLCFDTDLQLYHYKRVMFSFCMLVGYPLGRAGFLGRQERFYGRNSCDTT